MNKTNEPQKYIIDLLNIEPEYMKKLEENLNEEVIDLTLKAAAKRKEVESIQDPEEKAKAMEEAEKLDREVMDSVVCMGLSKHPEKLN